MPDLVKFSDLKDSQPLTLEGDDLLAVAHKEQSSSTGYSTMTTTPTQLSQYAVEEQTFANLKTSSKTVENSINQTISNLADDYDNTATYDVDDCVLYEGNLYKCITAIPVAEEWDSTHWEQVKAVDVGSGGELPTYEKSASGSVVSFTDGGDDIPVKSLVANIVATQESGTPSPSNPKPITAYDTVVVKIDDEEDVTQKTYSISLGDYIGRGTLDVTTGILTITHGYKDLGSLTYILSGSGQLRANVDNMNMLAQGQTEDDALCSHYELKHDITVTSFNTFDNVIGIGDVNLTTYSIAIRDSSITSASDAPTALAGRYIVYELETPVVIALSPIQVRTLLGTNKIYANSGNVAITYFTNSAGEIADLIETYTGNPVALYGTLATGSTSITFTSSAITDNSTIEVFNDLDVPYTSKTLTTGSLTLEFDAQESDMKIKVRVS